MNFLNFSTKAYLVGTQKNREHPKHKLKLMVKNIFTVLCSIFCLSKPLELYSPSGKMQACVEKLDTFTPGWYIICVIVITISGPSAHSRFVPGGKL